jgi:hypothetical protein
LKARLKWILAGIAALGLLAQFTNPTRTNRPVSPGDDLSATNAPPAEIAQLLRGACYNCHSDETQWPWYSRVAPVSWWVVDHVNSGRKRLNFSEWPHQDSQRAARKWNRISEEVSSGDMPLPSYTWVHPEARLTVEQRARLAKWAEQEAGRLQAETARIE